MAQNGPENAANRRRQEKPPNECNFWPIFGPEFDSIQVIPSTVSVPIKPPRGQLKQGRVERTTKDLVRLRQLREDDDYIEAEIDDVNRQLEHERELGEQGNGFKVIAQESFGKGVWPPRLLAGCTIQILQNMTVRSMLRRLD